MLETGELLGEQADGQKISWGVVTGRHSFIRIQTISQTIEHGGLSYCLADLA